MKKLLLLLLILNTGCASPQIISTPPEVFHPQRATTDKELIIEWQQSLIKIKEWQTWYDIQVGSNYFFPYPMDIIGVQEAMPGDE